MNLECQCIDSFCLKFLYLGFILFLHFIIWTVPIVNTVSCEANNFLIPGVAFETCIFSVFLLFLLILEYLEQVLPLKEIKEGGIFSKVPDWTPLVLFKIKIKQNPGCARKEYNVIFKLIHQNIRAYPRSKKRALINYLENVIVY